LALDQNHRVFRKNRGVFNSVEILDRLRREVAEKTVATQMAIKTALNAAQAGRSHWRSFISSRKRTASGGEQPLTRINISKLVAGRTARAEGDAIMTAWRLPFHLGSETPCLQH
jgi:hypothetical protein